MSYTLLKKMMLFTHPHPMPRPRAYAHAKGYATVTSPMGELDHIKQELKLYRQAVEDAFIGPLRIDMIFGIQSPKNSKYEAPIGRTSGDLDNHAKGILDLMQQKGINIIVDDKAVIELNTMKIYSDGPFIYVAVYKSEPSNESVEQLIMSLVEGEEYEAELTKLIKKPKTKEKKNETTTAIVAPTGELRGDSVCFPTTNEQLPSSLQQMPRPTRLNTVEPGPVATVQSKEPVKKNAHYRSSDLLSFLLSRNLPKG